MELTHELPGMPSRPYNEELRDRLAAYKRETGISDAELAKQVGSNTTAINRYLNKNPIGNTEALEELIVNFFDRIGIESQAPNVQSGLIKTSTFEDVFAGLNKIQRTQDFGLIVGPAGCGKSESVNKYLREKPLALGIEITRWSRADYAVERLLLAKFSARGQSNYKCGFDFILHKLKNSRRLLIVDGAHKLTPSGYECLFDLHDAAGIPIALVGNACMESAIKGTLAKQREKNEQHVSRIGLRIVLKPRFTKSQIVDFTKLHLADPSPELINLASVVANATGHFRTLRKHLLLVPDFLPASKNDAEAFEMAHTQLVTDVQLEAA